MLTDAQSLEFMKEARAILSRKTFPGGIDREDLVSDALLRACNSPDYDPDRSPFPAFVRVMVERSIGSLFQARECLKRGHGRTVGLDARTQDGALAVERAAFDVWERGRVAWDGALEREEVEAVQALTEREAATLQAFCDLGTAQDVASSMGVSVSTVSFHQNNAYRKLRVGALHLALLEAYRRGAIALPIEAEQA